MSRTRVIKETRAFDKHGILKIVKVEEDEYGLGNFKRLRRKKKQEYLKNESKK